MDKPILVFSFDGGGIRGILTARLLQDIATYLPMVDVFAGTSTGGILTVAVAAGKTPGQIVDFYRQYAQTIFRDSKYSWDDGATSVLYKHTGVVKAVEAILGSQAGQPLSSLSRNVVLTTFNVSSPRFGSQWNPVALTNLPGWGAYQPTILECILATAAAPVYFPPVQTNGYGWCVDGGVFANNPSLFALTTMIRAGFLAQSDLADVRILSLGTGATLDQIPPSGIGDPLAWGLVNGWGNVAGTPPLPLISLMFDASSEIIDSLADTLLPEGAYMRAEVPLRKSVALDADDPATIQYLVDAAESYIRSSQWQNVRAWLRGIVPSVHEEIRPDEPRLPIQP